MINIIREDSTINPELKLFPAAAANVAIFGTQSSGKSTLLNEVFGTHFPVLDTSVTRERCTKGVWLHNIGGFNLIDTEGFDSADRQVHQKMFEKQMALFCLALSDVLIINMWMTEIGRYEASHSHILKAIVRASQKVIAKQQKKIIFVVRDCTDDADRSILRDELNTHMLGLIKAQSQKSNVKFNLEYLMMSHYYEAQRQFKKEAKDLLKMISLTRKSNLSNYSDQDRMVYVSNLWQKVTTDSDIDLRTAEDALRNYALERIKNETLDFMEEWIHSFEDLTKHKTYLRYKEAVAKQARLYFLDLKPKHLREQELQPFILTIIQKLQSKQNKHFMTVLLPNQEDRLIEFDYKKKVDALQGSNVVYFKKNMERRKEQIEEAYRMIVKGLREHAKMTRRFAEKIENANAEYVQYLQHLHNVFKIDLQTALNEQADRQTKQLKFQGSRIKKVVAEIEEKHKAESKPYFRQIWERIIQRTCNSTVVSKIKSEGETFTMIGLGVLAGNQTENIITFYRKLQQKAEKYLQDLVSYNCEEEDTAVTLQRFDNIRKLINEMIDIKIIEDSRRFKITLVFVALLMYFFYSEFKMILKVFGMGKRRIRNWIWLYTMTMLGMFGVLLYRKRDYLRKFIEPVQQTQ